MEPHRNFAIADLKAFIAVREGEKKRLQAIIARWQNPEQRSQALGELAIVLKELKKDTDLLARVESE